MSPDNKKKDLFKRCECGKCIICIARIQTRSQPHTITYYKMPDQEGVRVIIGEEQWPERSLKAKACTPERLLYSRAATADEVEDICNAYRCQGRIYDDVDTLFKNERTILAPPQFELLELSIRSKLYEKRYIK